MKKRSKLLINVRSKLWIKDLEEIESSWLEWRQKR
jgi:hypothetical protein